jgi:putative DNA primase/helicase
VFYWGNALRYCHLWRKWLVWDGRRWRVDDTAGAMRLAKDTARRIFHEAAAVEPEDATKQAEREAEAKRKQLTAWAFATQTKSALRNMLELAASEPGIPVLPADLDRDPWVLNVRNGTIDLRTGQLRPHRRADLLTKLAPVDYRPDAPCPTWERFLARVMNGDQELIGFLQRAVGYSCTGDVSEEILLLLHGVGANGKSKFLETIQAALGQYAQEAPGDLLLSKRRGGIPNDVARLMGARFVASIETGEGESLDEGLVKHLTGGDTITARYLYGEFFEFAPTHKLWLSTNHKPSVFGTDEGIWRRILLVPFTAYIPPQERDKRLLDKLRAELAGVLAWIVGGCLEWQRQGLHPPAKVTEATSKYRADQDDLGAWIEQRCIRTDDARATFKELYDSYEAWCAAGRLTPVNSREFGSSLTERGFPAIKGSHGAAVRVGLRLRGVDEGDASSTPLTSGNGERVDGVTRSVQKNDFPPYARGVVATHVTPSTPAPFSQVDRGDQAEVTSTPPPSEAAFADEPVGDSADERRRQLIEAIAAAGGSPQDHADAQRLAIEAPDLAALIDPTTDPPTPPPWGQDAPLAWALVELERRTEGTA